jgi:uncharacterized protein YggE
MRPREDCRSIALTKEFIMHKFSLPCLVLLVLAFASRVYALDEPSITTTGTSTVYVVPDKATVSIGLSSTDKEIDKAKADNEAQAVKVLKAVKDLGIVDANIATDRMSVGTHYDEVSRKPDGFYASRNYSIEVKDLRLLEKLVDAIVKVGGSVPSVELEHSDLRKYRDQARQMALRAASEKATAMAKELNCTVGRPRTIVEGSTGGSRSYYEMGSNNNSAGMDMAPPPADTPETVPLGKIAVTATVTVTFELK